MASGEQRALLHKTYKQLRCYGESATFLRHCVATHSKTRCAESALVLLRLHQQTMVLSHQLAETSRFRLLRRCRLRAQRRGALIRLYALRSRLRVWNALSDMLVMLIIVFSGLVAIRLFTISRIWLAREEQIHELSKAVISTIYQLESVGKKNLEGDEQ